MNSALNYRINLAFLEALNRGVSGSRHRVLRRTLNALRDRMTAIEMELKHEVGFDEIAVLFEERAECYNAIDAYCKGLGQ